MLKSVEFDAKTVTEATKKAVEMLKLSADKIKLEIVKEKKGILGIGASATYRAVANVDLPIEGKKYLDDLLGALQIEAKMELKNISESEIYYKIQSSENALLIGKEGRTLLAIQALLRSYLSNFVDHPLLITLDIGDYYENRKRQLEILATKTAKEVVRQRKAIKLEPMNAFDRRIVHTKLSEWRDVETESEGQGEQRAIVIVPKHK